MPYSAGTATSHSQQCCCLGVIQTEWTCQIHSCSSPRQCCIPHFPWAPRKWSPRHSQVCVSCVALTQAHSRWILPFRTVFSKGTACPVDLCWEPESGLSTLSCCWKLSCSVLFMPKVKALWRGLVFKYLWLVCGLTSYHPASKTRISAWLTAGSSSSLES